ncbi:MAG: GvpL/GvpF family gas vesicle protein [Candidatus Jettenia sp.]|nr:MAG: GvpL/GvpF family gas vesicle protein [Candidatus Jettenia sp.]
MANNGKYIYGFTRNDVRFGLSLAGIDGKQVYTISDNGIAAVVSDGPGGRLRPERKNLSAHNSVIKEVMKTSSILPVSFGVVADNETGIKKILKLNHNSFVNQLKRLGDKVEMGLKVIWDVENIFEFMVRTHRSLELFRDNIFLKPTGATQEEKMELGRMFETIMNQEREKHTATVQSILKSYCCEIKVNKPKDEKTVMKLACLVEKASLEQFEKGIFEAAKVFDDNYAFDFHGPWAPHNFVEIKLKMA